MFLLKLAVKNVLRQSGRTLLSMVAIIFGVMALILGRGFVSGMKENMIRAQVDALTGHVVAMPADYPTTGGRFPIDELLTLTEAERAWLADRGYAWTVRTFFTPRVVRGRDAMRVRAIGFDPGRDEQIFPRGDWTLRREPTNAGASAVSDDGVLISAGIARIFGVGPGDTLLFESRTVDGALNALELPISGVFESGNPALDRVTVLMPRPLVHDLIQHGEAFSHLVLRLESRYEAFAVAQDLAEQLGTRAKVRTWRQESQALVEAQEIRQRILDVIAFVLLAIAATGIANTVLMAAYERVREIGTLRALGLRRTGVAALFLLEGAVLGVVGALAGALAGGALVSHWAVSGIDLSGFADAAGAEGMYDDLPFTSMLYMEFSWATILGAAAFGLAVALLSSIYPAVVATRLAPADAVRAT